MPKRVSDDPDEQDDVVSKKSPRKYVTWNKRDEELLLCWWEEPANFLKWKHSKIISAGGGDTRLSTSGQTQKSILKEVIAYLKRNGSTVERQDPAIRTKLKYLENSWKAAHAMEKGTGEGLTEEEKELTLEEKRLSVCPHWERLDKLLTARPGMVPPSVADNLNGPPDMNFLMTFTSSETLERINEDQTFSDMLRDAEAKKLAIEEGADNINSGKECSSVRVSPNREGPKKGLKATPTLNKGKANKLMNREYNENVQRPAGSTKLSMAEVVMRVEERKAANSDEKYDILERQMKLKEKEFDLRSDEIKLKLMQAENEKLALQLKLANGHE